MHDKVAHYPQPQENFNFPAMEEKILHYWQEQQIFKRSITNRAVKSESNSGATNPEQATDSSTTTSAQAAEYVFFDGPPFANGLPHYGHLLTGYLKDLYARYHTMKGQKVERKFGWDTHGLPVEMETEKTLGVSGRQAIEAYGVDKFNDACRNSVLRYTAEWEKQVTRAGRWVDFQGGYKTLNLNYMESVIWAFKELYRKGLLYEDYRVMPYSWKCQTPVSNFETLMDNSYRERADKSATVMFTTVTVPEIMQQHFPNIQIQAVKLLAWTTTPWTLPSNLALACGADIDYALVLQENTVYVLAAKLAAKYAKELPAAANTEFPTVKGTALAGIHYIPLFPYLQNLPAVTAADHAYSVLLGDFVTTEDGTGIVHLAPGFGEDDRVLCKQHAIPTICPVDDGGCFTDIVPDYQGKQVFEANDEIILRLKTEGKWVRTEQFLHNYPHCWRTDTPLIYRALSSWYVKVSAFKDAMLRYNQQINWIPHNVKDGQFGKWLEGARDWSITRNRFWGCPVPVWKSDDPQYPRIDVYGSIAELEADFGVKVTNLHRPFIDQLTRPNPDDPTGKSTMRRVTDVLDCWFESGSMPYAQAHYPFENKSWFEQHFPCDFITEYIGQTRGWFYTLLVLSTALFDRPPFLNCICHGIILDSEGKKLSKRLRNYVDPVEAFNTYGSDAMRWLMIQSPVTNGLNLRVSADGADLKETLRLSIKPIINAYNFFCLYANSDGIQATRSFASKNIMDQYIISKLHLAVEQIDQSLADYNTIEACSAVNDFFDVLNNWYIRRNKERFWKTEIDDDKLAAYNTLYSVLLTFCEASACLLPFTTEQVWLGLQGKLA